MDAILRNEQGEFIMEASKMENEVANPTTIEALALLRGLQFCVTWGMPMVILESDCLMLVNEYINNRFNINK